MEPKLRKRTIQYVRFPRTVRRPRRREELPYPRNAIRMHCLECCGWNSGEVVKCSAPRCWLYPWRFGKAPLGWDSAHGKRVFPLRAANNDQAST